MTAPLKRPPWPLLVLFGLALVHFPAPQAPAEQAQRPASFAEDQVTIDTARGRFSFRVELALTQEQRARGLMFRKHLPPDTGMLFVYERTQHVAMWMKNTLIALDILFLDSGGRILSMTVNARPRTLDLIPSRFPVRAVLELPAGTVERLDVRPGDKVISSLLSDLT